MASFFKRLFRSKKPYTVDVSKMGSVNYESTKAIVSREPKTLGTTEWSMETVKLGPVGDDEVLVRITATGICHTDVITTACPTGLMGIEYPRVAGHEGSGYVLKCGKNVTKTTPGDPVILSLDYCGSCRACSHGRITHCPNINELNFNATKDRFRTSDDEPIVGSFFGQSSFANVTIVKSNSVVNVKGLVNSEDELRTFAPMGCGFLAGAGTVINVAKAEKVDRVLIMGLGGVGLAAVMAAKICGCDAIIVLDRIESRLELAKELGATHTLNSSDNLLENMRGLTDGLGANIVIDATGVPALISLGLDICAPGGKMVMIGTPPPDAEIKFDALSFMQSSKQIISSIEGACIPSEFIPKMISWYRDNKFPIAKLIKYYEADDYENALHEMHSGAVVKPVLLFDTPAAK